VTTWTDVGSWADLRRSGRLIASLDGREIGVLAVDGDGSVCAVRNRLPASRGAARLRAPSGP
jgi:hypothetical protein